MPVKPTQSSFCTLYCALGFATARPQSEGDGLHTSTVVQGPATELSEEENREVNVMCAPSSHATSDFQADEQWRNNSFVGPLELLQNLSGFSQSLRTLLYTVLPTSVKCIRGESTKQSENY